MGIWIGVVCSPPKNDVGYEVFPVYGTAYSEEEAKEVLQENAGKALLYDKGMNSGWFVVANIQEIPKDVVDAQCTVCAEDNAQYETDDDEDEDVEQAGDELHAAHLRGEIDALGRRTA